MLAESGIAKVIGAGVAVVAVTVIYAFKGYAGIIVLIAGLVGSAGGAAVNCTGAAAARVAAVAEKVIIARCAIVLWLRNTLIEVFVAHPGVALVG